MGVKLDFPFPFRSLPLLRALALGAALLAATSCSKLRLGYEYADWLLLYSVDENFDLDKAQRTQVKENVAEYLRWHRKQMLPAYADFLAWAADSARNGLRLPEIDSGYARYRILRMRTLEPVVEKSVAFLNSLAPDQVDSWRERQRKKNLKLRKEFSGSLEDRLDQRYEKIIDELEDWTGKLNPDQKSRIKALSRIMPWNGNLWLDNREKTEDSLAVLLKRRAPQGELLHFMEDFYLHPEALRTGEYQLRCKEFDFRMRTVIYGVYRMLTPPQKQHFFTQVEKLASDFRKLSLQE